jgi:hypothetical protein
MSDGGDERCREGDGAGGIPRRRLSRDDVRDLALIAVSVALCWGAAALGAWLIFRT